VEKRVGPTPQKASVRSFSLFEINEQEKQCKFI